MDAGVTFSQAWLDAYYAKRGHGHTGPKAKQESAAQPAAPFTRAGARARDLAPFGPIGMREPMRVRFNDGGQTQTERDYNRKVLLGVGRFEPMTLHLPSGLKYTPDFLTLDTGGRVCLHEVKGSYRLQSYQRARLAFLEAVAAFPVFRFVWAELGKDGEFHCTEWEPERDWRGETQRNLDLQANDEGNRHE